MGMQVIKTSFESTVHNICADLVQHEMKASIVTAPLYALSARVIAVAAHAWWLGNEVIQFVPHIIGLSFGVAFSEKPSFARAAQVYSLYFKTLGAQAVLGSMACVAPEVTHYALELHKPLFSLQLETFVETLPDLPHVQKDVRKAFPLIDSVAQLYKRLGLTNSMWKQELKASVMASPDPNYLTTSSKEFQGVFLRTLFFSCAKKLNEVGITRESIDGLHPGMWKHLVEYLTPENQVQLIERLKETIIDHEINNYFLEFYKLMTGFTFRAADTVSVLRLYVVKMNEVAKKLIREGRFKQDDIESVGPDVIMPMRLRGLVELIDHAKLDGDTITFNDVRFSEDFHFFGKKGQAVELKKAYDILDDEDKKALVLLCHDNELQVGTANCGTCFGLFKAFEWEVIHPKLKGVEDVEQFSKVNWFDAFVI